MGRGLKKVGRVGRRGSGNLEIVKERSKWKKGERGMRRN